MNINNTFAAIVALLIAVFAAGCEPMDDSGWAVEEDRSSIIVGPCPVSQVDDDGSGDIRFTDPADDPFIGDIRKGEPATKWTSTRIEEEDDSDEIDDTFANGEIERIEEGPEGPTDNETAEEIAELELEDFEGVLEDEEEEER